MAVIYIEQEIGFKVMLEYCYRRRRMISEVFIIKAYFLLSLIYIGPRLIYSTFIIISNQTNNKCRNTDHWFFQGICNFKHPLYHFWLYTLLVFVFLFLLQGIQISYVGKSKTSWTESEGGGDNKSTVTYCTREKYFEEKIIILGKCKLIIMKIQVTKLKFSINRNDFLLVSLGTLLPRPTRWKFEYCMGLKVAMSLAKTRRKKNTTNTLLTQLP